MSPEFAAQVPRESRAVSQPITSLHIIVWLRPSTIDLTLVPLPAPIFQRPVHFESFSTEKSPIEKGGRIIHEVGGAIMGTDPRKSVNAFHHASVFSNCGLCPASGMTASSAPGSAGLLSRSPPCR
jgi:hypothetical protein